MDRCPICQKEAHIHRALRPKSHTRTRTHIHHFTHQHLWGYYTLNCPHHHVPIYWGDRQEIEEHMGQVSYQLLQVESEIKMPKYTLLWGSELAGSLVDQGIRESLREQYGLFAYAFFPDVIAVSLLPFEEEVLSEAKVQAQQWVEQKAPHRQWSLNWSVDLN